MSLISERLWGNSYVLKDKVVEANVELLGGGSGMLIILQSIKAISHPSEDGTGDIQFLANYLAGEIIKHKRYGPFVMLHKGKVIFSLNEELKSGTEIDTKNIQRISMGEYGRIVLRDTVAALKRVFSK